MGKICDRFYSTFTAKIAVFGNVFINSEQNIAENSNVWIIAEKSNVENIAVYGNSKQLVLQCFWELP